MRDNTQLTLTQIIKRHWQALIDETSIKESAFATKVREHYERFPEHVREVEFSTHADPHTRMERDREKISRWFSQGVSARLPTEIIESVIAAFPPERRQALQVEVMARQGLIAAQLPDEGFAAAGVTLGRMCQEHGEAVQRVAELMQDGKIDHMDRAGAPEALREIDQAIGALISMRRLIRRDALGESVPMAEIVDLQEVSNG